MIIYKSVSKLFKSKGFTHQQIDRRGDIALYLRFKEGQQMQHYEVVRIRRHDGYLIPKKEDWASPSEMYPTSTQWGANGWTLPDESSARKKMEELCSDEAKRKMEAWLKAGNTSD